jgi:hypothetical protein
MSEGMTLSDVLDYMENLKHEELPKRSESVSKLGVIATYLG